MLILFLYLQYIHYIFINRYIIYYIYPLLKIYNQKKKKKKKKKIKKNFFFFFF